MEAWQLTAQPIGGLITSHHTSPHLQAYQAFLARETARLLEENPHLKQSQIKNKVFKLVRYSANHCDKYQTYTRTVTAVEEVAREPYEPSTCSIQQQEEVINHNDK